MMTRRERAKKCYFESGHHGQSIHKDIDIIEHHLIEYAEEAVREERQKVCDALTGRDTLREKCAACGEYCPRHAAKCVKCGCKKTLAEGLRSRMLETCDKFRPTPEDALRAVEQLASAILFGGISVKMIRDGIVDLLAGKRDTEAAKAITGEGK